MSTTGRGAPSINVRPGTASLRITRAPFGVTPMHRRTTELRNLRTTGEKPHVKDDKFIVFKREAMEKWMVSHSTEGLPIPVPDAVVIRRQDVFAPPAFDAYANAIQCVIEALLKLNRGAEIREEKPDRPWDYTPDEVAKRLQGIADYFHAQASIAYDTERKLPD